MQELLKFYTKSLIGLVGLVTAWVLFVPKDLMPFLVPYLGVGRWTPRIANALTSRLFVVGLLAFGELFIRKWLWRIVHPELNFKGDWEGESKYLKVEIGAPGVPFSAKHKVTFEQDCISFSLAPTTSAEYVNWGSLAANLVDKYTVRYAYWVKYSDPSRFPAEAKGYEELRVTTQGWRGRPKELTGDFYHCAMGLKPVYSGKVTFKRKANAKT